jgi:hypothetical protein
MIDPEKCFTPVKKRISFSIGFGRIKKVYGKIRKLFIK